MMLLDGEKASSFYKQKISSFIAEQQHVSGFRPCLSVVLVGNDPRSKAYVGAKMKTCKELGFEGLLVELPITVTEKELLHRIEELNANPTVSGIIVQLPLPKHIDPNKVIECINPTKDVDGFSAESMGQLILQLPTFISATPLGILMLLDYYNIEPKGKHVVIVGRSNIVGRPLSILLSQAHRLGNATVTLCHSHSKNLEEITAQADILIVAIGRAKSIGKNMIKKDSVVIDVGINSIFSEEKQKNILVGDVDFESVKENTQAITPVPGGVGKMTIVALMHNTLWAYCRQNGISSFQNYI